MNPGKRVLIVFIAATFLGLLASFFFSKKEAAPNIGWTDIKGQSGQLSELQGKVVLVNFWATDCTTCVKEMPMFIDTYNKYQSEGFTIVGIAMAHDKLTYIENFVAQKNIPFTVGHDVDGSRSVAFGTIQATPTSFLIDKQGNIIKRYLGEPKHDEFIHAIESALKS